MYTEELNQLHQWFDTKEQNELRNVCRFFASPLKLEPNDPLLQQLELKTDINWSIVLHELSRFPAPPEMRHSLMRYLTGILAFMRRATEPCGDWLPEPSNAYLMMQRPAENASWLNLFLKKPLPETPEKWTNAASLPLGEWIPFELLSGDEKGLAELIPVFSHALLIDNQELQPDLDYLLRLPLIQEISNLRDQIEEEIYQTLQAQCDSLCSEGLTTEQIEHYYTQVRFFFSSQPVFTSWQQADNALKAYLLDGDAALMVVPAEYRRRLLNKALVQVPHDGKKLPLCPSTGIPLWKDYQHQWQTISRDPQIRQKVTAEILLPIMDEAYINLTNYYQLHPQIIRDWYLPGQLELKIAEVAEKAGWIVTLWPKRDQVDVLCKHPESSLSLAIDGKDWRNAYLLGRSFNGFKSYSDPSQYLGLVVVPDYQLAQPKYKERFRGGQIHQGVKTLMVDLKTFSKLVEEPAKINTALKAEGVA
ncbi:hypothetical protein [Pseudoalteromonas sp. Of7M-16]|uniref:restriction endonuclease-related protein n=1 Tax=Pseudoalteromonas sp. Of7M-16 TaxID=2917756 RepID=UPI001EF70430|nr:hypothetical protein [Pseudoalteromonas sp. Of7M-16]MCG7548796.1 hypothetical protein [Pseudoalteromonas sp. Of7M-16]